MGGGGERALGLREPRARRGGADTSLSFLIAMLLSKGAGNWVVFFPLCVELFQTKAVIIPGS